MDRASLSARADPRIDIPHVRCVFAELRGVQITRFTDLALRVTLRLAVLEDGARTTTTVLARELCVPRSHVAKVVTALQRLGVVETRRGRAGGLRLADVAPQISIGHIVRSLEGPGEVVQCEGPTPCPLRSGCRLRGALRRAQEAFFAALDPVTVAAATAQPTRTLLVQLGAPPTG